MCHFCSPLQQVAEDKETSSTSLMKPHVEMGYLDKKNCTCPKADGVEGEAKKGSLDLYRALVV